ncbi:MAG: ParB/RepB/Spo0J family partition protein [Oscillospiraceae bacterium]|nr:ParB/RepB/Spo0J family partition protein [Oscillospiraceae bacterium]
MAAKKSGLGRGLDALFADNSVEENSGASAVKLKLMDIEPNRDQPRKAFDEEALSELAESIAKHGILQPLLVRPLSGGGYRLIAGERRWRAARLAGLTEAPVVVREMTDEEEAVFALIENLQREDLNPLEEATGFRTLMDKFSLTQEEAAEKVGKSRPAVANALRLLKLPEPVLRMVGSGELSAGHARALIPIEDEPLMLELAGLIVSKGLSVRETERRAKALSKPRGGEKMPEQHGRREVFYDEVELTLTETLCRKIKVLNGRNGTGTVEIAFHDKEDLTRLANALNALED